MAAARISGQSCSLPEAAAEAARLLLGSRLPVLAGMATDVAGVRAAIRLAARIGGTIDHLASDMSLRNLSVMRDAGWMIVSPGEVRHRADVILLVGPGIGTAWNGLADRILSVRSETTAERRLICLGCGSYARTLARMDLKHQVVSMPPHDLPSVLAALRARIAGRPVALRGGAARKIDEVAGHLLAARFGTAIWSAAGLDALAIEMLAGLVKDLNARTRFSCLPLPGPDNVTGADEVSGWMTGFPMRTSLSRGYPEHDPWRFEATRLVESGEADCTLWISAYRPLPPPWQRSVPTIALTATGTRFAEPPAVQVDVGVPGTDCDGIAHLVETGGLGNLLARHPSGRPTTADVLAAIAGEVRPLEVRA